MKNPRNVLKLFFGYYFVSFAVFYFGIEYYRSNYNIKSTDFHVFSEFCESIQSIHPEKGDIYINISKSTRLFDIQDARRRLALSTAVLNNSAFFPNGSGDLVVFSNFSYKLSFSLPLIGEYDARLYCISNPHLNFTSIHDLSPFIDKKFTIQLKIEKFPDNSNFSTMNCHGSDFLTRWCEGRNLIAYDDNIFFLSPGYFQFPEPFLVPGPRAPPFDKVADRLVSEPIVVQYTIQTFPRKYSILDKISYLYGTYYNYYMLWHSTFDFILPFYRFIHDINRTESIDERIIFVKSDGVWSFHSLMKVISSEPIRILSREPSGLLLPVCFLGIIKYESNISLQRSHDDSVNFRYNFDASSVPNFRNDLLDALSLPTGSVGDNGKPLVILVDRSMTKRNFDNQDQLYSLLVNTCDFCEVKAMKMENWRDFDQVKLISKASVLIGLHGSGLAHVLWMSNSRENHSTHLLEILPYNYSCRPWYKTASDVAGVEYHPIMNKIPSPELTNKYGYCWKNTHLCGTITCHDLLRDQPFTLDLESFNETWIPIVHRLKKTIILP